MSHRAYRQYTGGSLAADMIADSDLASRRLGSACRLHFSATPVKDICLALLNRFCKKHGISSSGEHDAIAFEIAKRVSGSPHVTHKSLVVSEYGKNFHIVYDERLGRFRPRVCRLELELRHKRMKMHLAQKAHEAENRKLEVQRKNQKMIRQAMMYDAERLEINRLINQLKRELKNEKHDCKNQKVAG